MRTVPIVTGISLSDPGADHTFSANEIIEVRVHFSEQVKFTGTGLVPTLEIDVGGQMRTPNSSTQGNTLVDALRLIYFLSAQRADADADGITVVAATLGLPSGTRLVNAAGHAARRGFAQWSFPNHRVDTAGPQVTGYGCWPKGGRLSRWLRLWTESLIPLETGWPTFAEAGPKVWSLNRLGVPPRLELGSTGPTEVCGAKSAWRGGS